MLCQFFTPVPNRKGMEGYLHTLISPPTGRLSVLCLCSGDSVTPTFSIDIVHFDEKKSRTLLAPAFPRPLWSSNQVKGVLALPWIVSVLSDFAFVLFSTTMPLHPQNPGQVQNHFFTKMRKFSFSCEISSYIVNYDHLIREIVRDFSYKNA